VEKVSKKRKIIFKSLSAGEGFRVRLIEEKGAGK
jgi:hypothetical protein